MAVADATLRDVQAAPHTRDLIAKIRTTERGLVRAGEWQGGRLKGGVDALARRPAARQDRLSSVSGE